MFSTTMKNYSQYYYKHPLTSAGGKKKRTPIDTNRIYPVLSAEQLLASKERTAVVHQIRMQSGAPVEYFNILYKKLIDNVAEFLQNLPSLKNRRIARLDRQLNIASISLSLREPYIVAGELLNRTTDTEKALWNYVVFSSLLLSRVGELVTQYHISLVSDKGIFQQAWEPLVGSMINQGQHYKIRSIIDNTGPTTEDLTVIIARALMPDDGFHWIASNAVALEEWLLGLQSDGVGKSEGVVADCYITLQKYLIANQKLIEEQNHELLKEYLEELLEEFLEEHHTAEDIPPALSSDPIDTRAGEDFYQWLRDGIEQDKISVNKEDSAVLVTSQGVLLLHPEIFDKFARENPRHHDAKQVFDQFKNLGLVSNKNIESYVTKLPGMQDKQVKGVLLPDPAALLGTKKYAQLTTHLLRSNATVRLGRMVQTARTMIQEKTHKQVVHELKLNEQAREEHEKNQFPKIRYATQGALNRFGLTNTPPRRGY